MVAIDEGASSDLGGDLIIPDIAVIPQVLQEAVERLKQAERHDGDQEHLHPEARAKTVVHQEYKRNI